MSQSSHTSKPFLRNLATDTTANTLAIAAASLVPLMAMVGGGVDASRYYMAETRLQAACDAGALAARKSVDEFTGFDSDDQKIGQNFFDHNFPEGLFGLEDMDRQYAADSENLVTGSASGKLPTTIMAAFGYQNFDISVACSADINISNTDIMFVLDVTGSMNCRAGDRNCGNNGRVEATDSKIDNVRASVLAFYDTVDSSTSSKAQVRYGIMPYSSQVNVGNSLSPSWMRARHTYQSREGDPVITVDFEPSSYEYQRTGGLYNWRDRGQIKNTLSNINSETQCESFVGNEEYDIYDSSNEDNWRQISQIGSDPRTTLYSGVVTYRYYETKKAKFKSKKKRCTLTKEFWTYSSDSRITVIEDRVEKEKFRWAYREVEWPISSIYSSQSKSINLPTGWEFDNENHSWNGCIEEADTVATDTFKPVPAGAYDLDIDLVPSREEEKWAPMLPSLVYERYNRGNRTRNNVYISREQDATDSAEFDYWTVCPKAARKLERFESKRDLEQWISEDNGFVARGFTYHDYGMIWGARFISPDGIFASENATTRNGDSIARHIVFMTDGEQYADDSAYGLYGQEWWNRKITSDGSEDQLFDRHSARFQAVCRAARNKNISVWVVAFDTAEVDDEGEKVVPENLKDCATPGRSYLAEDAEGLDQAFREIAEKIAALRLTA